MEGMLEVDEDLIYLATDMNLYEIAQDVDGLRVVFEGYVDLDYRSDRSLIVEKTLADRDPKLAADRFFSIVTEGVVEAADGTELSIPADSISSRRFTSSSMITISNSRRYQNSSKPSLRSLFSAGNKLFGFCCISVAVAASEPVVA